MFAIMEKDEDSLVLQMRIQCQSAMGFTHSGKLMQGPISEGRHDLLERGVIRRQISLQCRAHRYFSCPSNMAFDQLCFIVCFLLLS
jgi:hypothetical protein